MKVSETTVKVETEKMRVLSTMVENNCVPRPALQPPAPSQNAARSTATLVRRDSPAKPPNSDLHERISANTDIQGRKEQAIVVKPPPEPPDLDQLRSVPPRREPPEMGVEISLMENVEGFLLLKKEKRVVLISYMVGLAFNSDDLTWIRKEVQRANGLIGKEEVGTVDYMNLKVMETGQCFVL
ncbi:hypothetical protein L195_g054639, partial [Trifolium pratense]